jgi:hypothetical protein
MSIIAEPEVIGFHRGKLNWVKSAALYYRQRWINSSSTIAPARLAPVRLSPGLSSISKRPASVKRPVKQKGPRH